ncbi:hypothetical protein CW304_23305 [Bacillus sp. UFRGS-B20]|nr:hypothetical protein CW304_23305 [Bacillus sp. UFRGS-B20]
MAAYIAIHIPSFAFKVTVKSSFLVLSCTEFPLIFYKAFSLSFIHIKHKFSRFASVSKKMSLFGFIPFHTENSYPYTEYA